MPPFRRPAESNQEVRALTPSLEIAKTLVSIAESDRRINLGSIAQSIMVLPAWLTRKLNWDDRGQATTEYVMLILGVALFLIVAAIALQSVLNGPIGKITIWISRQNGP